jgi:hypothetical protein
MNRAIRLLLIVAVLSITAHRLPAPISEVSTPTPTPKPKREPTKSKSDATPKAKITPALSFAGTWSASGSGVYSVDNTAVPERWTVKISADEKTALLTGQGGNFIFPCYRKGDTLSWSFDDRKSTSTTTIVMQMKSDRTASYVQNCIFVKGTTYKSFGMLTK